MGKDGGVETAYCVTSYAALIFFLSIFLRDPKNGYRIARKQRPAKGHAFKCGGRASESGICAQELLATERATDRHHLVAIVIRIFPLSNSAIASCVPHRDSAQCQERWWRRLYEKELCRKETTGVAANLSGRVCSDLYGRVEELYGVACEALQLLLRPDVARAEKRVLDTYLLHTMVH